MVSPDSRYLIVLSPETSEISSHVRGEHESHGLLLSKFSIAQIDHIFSIRFPSRPRGILAVSSDARFLVLQTFDGFQRGALAVLTSTGELLYEFALSIDSNYVSLIENESILLVHGHNELTFRNSSTGQLIRRLKVDFGFVPRRLKWRLKFDAITQHIHTNSGTIAPHEHLTDEDHRKLSLNEDLIRCRISDDRSWLLWNDKKVFWLPPEFRPWGKSIEVFGSTIIIGTETGRVLFFKFDLHNLLKVL
jgi:hypothetical protein